MKKTLTYIDSHAHVNDSAFDTDRDSIIAKSFGNDVNLIVEIACCSRDWEKGISLTKRFPGKIFCALGIHPQNCEDFTPENMSKLKELFKQKAVVGLGEIGFDYAIGSHSKELQKEVFSGLLSFAKDPKKPLILHCRNPFEPKDGNAYSDMFSIIKQKHSSNKEKSGILHCFSGEYSDAKTAIDLGFLLGVNGTITYPKNEALRETVRKVGPKNIVIETDCPYLPPQNHRGKRNDPSLIPEIYRFVSETSSTPLKKTLEMVYENCVKLFEL
jgi:TatD DNase family protein